MIANVPVAWYEGHMILHAYRIEMREVSLHSMAEYTVLMRLSKYIWKFLAKHIRIWWTKWEMQNNIFFNFQSEK